MKPDPIAQKAFNAVLAKHSIPYHCPSDCECRTRGVELNAQHEPPYPGLPTVVISIRSPSLLIHAKRDDCPHEYPHRWEECGLVAAADSHEEWRDEVTRIVEKLVATFRHDLDEGEALDVDNAIDAIASAGLRMLGQGRKP
jgi:hypothetical protein